MSPETIASLLSFLAYLGVSVAATAAFILIYCQITPYHERELIQRGNVAAAIALAGVVLGFALPIASAVAHSVSLRDLSIWALVAAIVQLLGYLSFRVVFRTLRAQIEADQRALPILYAATSLALGLLNAAAMTY